MNTDKGSRFFRAKRKKLSRIFAESMIINFLINLTDIIYKKLSESFFGVIFAGDGTEKNISGGSLFINMRRKINIKGRVIKPFKLWLVRSFEQSALLNFGMQRLKRLLAVSVSVYGVFLCSFGLYTVIVYFLAEYAFNLMNHEVINLYAGAGITLISIPLLTVRKPLAEALRESVIMNFALFNVMGLRREIFDTKRAAEAVKNNVAFVLGMLLGLLSYFIPPVYIILGIFGIIGAYLLIVLPEFGVILMILTAPFLPTMIIAGFTIFIACCYLLKLMRGKRSLKFQLIDIMVLLFAALTLSGGIFSVSREMSIKPAMLYTVFMLGYFLVVNLMRSGEWIKRCVAALSLSSFAVALYGVYQNYFGLTEVMTLWQDEKMFGDIRGRVVSAFENPNVLAEYLIMALLFTAALVVISKKLPYKLLAAAMCGVTALCLVFTWSRGAWLGILIGAMLFLLIINKKSMILVICGIIAAPFLPFVLPQNVISRFTSIGSIRDTSTSYRVNIWRAVIAMIKDHFGGGIGVGEGAFAKVYPLYSLAGIESAPHSHNLYLQILVEIGMAGLLVFLAVVIIFIRNNFSLYRIFGFESEHKTERVLSAAGFCAVISVLIQGMTDYIWYNYRVFFVFWLVIGLTAAMRRSALNEWTGSERLGACVDLIYDRNNKNIGAKTLLPDDGGAGETDNAEPEPSEEPII